MNIVLGSTSPEKRHYLENCLHGQIPFIKLATIKVNSEVSDQPLSIEETTEGAINRAKNAFAKFPKSDLAVGMEGGLEKIGGIYNLVCVAAFWDGGEVIVGKSGHLPLPVTVSDEVKSGEEFGKSIRRYLDRAAPDEKERVEQLISRELSFESAINNAMPQLKAKYGVSILNGWLVALNQIFDSPEQLPTRLLRLSSLLTGFYFTFGSVLLFLSLLRGTVDVFISINALIPAALILILIALGMYLIKTKIIESKDTTRNLVIILGMVLLLLLVNVYILGSYLTSAYVLHYLLESMGATTVAIINTVGIGVIAIFGYLLHLMGRDSKPSMATIAYLIIGSIGIVQSFVLVAGSGSPLVTFPILAVGILWCIGVWSLANDMEALLATRELHVEAVQKFDRT